MQYKGVNHLALATGNLEETIAFWRDLLGMRMVVSMGHEGRRQYFFQAGEAMVAFFEWDGVEPGPEKDHGAPVKGPFTFDHISFEMQDDDSIWELKDKLDAADVWVSEMIDHGFLKSIYTFDNNNIPLEFSCTVAGCDVREVPQFADRDPLPIGLEGSEPNESRWPVVTEPTPMEERWSYEGDGKELFPSDEECGIND
ncbi:MAG: VOC family protein [Desulfovibrio sp.]